MDGLKIEHWHQWEELSRLMLSQFVFEKTNLRVEYRSFGSRGQSQFGIDLVPVNHVCTVVGQCKLKESKSFTLNELNVELRKTDDYKNKIGCYVIFTTAERHTSIQTVENATPGGRIIYTRGDGSTFPVYVRYWRDETPQSLFYIPKQTLAKVFPAAFEIAAQFLPTTETYTKSLDNLREEIPYWLPNTSLQWLMSWDFKVGYVRESDIDPFIELFHEVDRTNTAVKDNILEWLHVGRRRKIVECLVAGKRLFDALNSFVASIRADSIGENLPDGTSILSLQWNSRRQAQSQNWENKARYLALVYLEDVLGQQPY